jgi:hypothetical protein
MSEPLIRLELSNGQLEQLADMLAARLLSAGHGLAAPSLGHDAHGAALGQGQTAGLGHALPVLGAPSVPDEPLPCPLPGSGAGQPSEQQQGSTHGEGLLSAAKLAERLGCSRAFVYSHADELGVVRLGEGPRARLRFDLETALGRYGSKQSQGENPSNGGASQQHAPQRGRALATRRQETAPSLPSRPRPRKVDRERTARR